MLFSGRGYEQIPESKDANAKKSPMTLDDLEIIWHNLHSTIEELKEASRAIPQAEAEIVGVLMKFNDVASKLNSANDIMDSHSSEKSSNDMKAMMLSLKAQLTDTRDVLQNMLRIFYEKIGPAELGKPQYKQYLLPLPPARERPQRDEYVRPM